MSKLVDSLRSPTSVRGKLHEQGNSRVHTAAIFLLSITPGSIPGAGLLCRLVTEIWGIFLSKRESKRVRFRSIMSGGSGGGEEDVWAMVAGDDNGSEGRYEFCVACGGWVERTSVWEVS